MSEATIQIFDISDVVGRANLARNAKRINVYNGHLTGANNARNVLIFQTARNEGEPWNADDLNYIQTLRGRHTIVFMPQKEFMLGESNVNPRPGYTIPMQGIYSLNGPQNEQPGHEYNNAGQLELVNRILSLERENEKLKNELSEALEDLEQFETAGGKFAYSLEQVFFSIAPKLGINLGGLNTQQPKQQQPMDGTNQDWKEIDCSGNTEQHVENALIVLVEAFGADFVLKF